MEQKTEPKYSLDDIAFLVGSSTVPGDGSQKGKSFLAFSGAMIWPGLGHLLAGNVKWAGIWFLIWNCIVIASATVLVETQWIGAMIFLVQAGLIVQAIQLRHASWCGKRSARSMLGDSSIRYAAGMILAAVGVAECYGLANFLQANCFEIGYSPTPSMAPNIVPGDLFVYFNQGSYRRWDILAIVPPPGYTATKYLCKRLVGLPGEKIEITGFGLMINDKPVKIPAHVGPYLAVDSSNQELVDAEPLSAGNGCWGRPIVLGPDEYFFLGDNTSESYDARLWPSEENRQPGATPRDMIKGRVVGIVWPPDRWRAFDSIPGN
jgi:signal peptidase I